MNAHIAAFDNDKYIALQSAAIRDRAKRFDNKLYLEIGGKLLKDLHAARILPGFEPDVKLRMLRSLGDQIEFIVCAYAGDIEHRRYRADFGTTYDTEVRRLIDDVRACGLKADNVVLTRFDPSFHHAANFAEGLRRDGIKVHLHSAIPGYPSNVELILSDAGFGANPYVETTAPIVGVIAPGPSSGKLATCLSQVWHENQRGVKAGYAKYETFPVWNLPLNHPVNVAYEAATVDIEDFNQIDPFHLEAYGKTAINYNRDVEIFPVLNALFEGIYGENPYKSPTDMGVNMIGFCISDDEVCCKASKNEIIRRFYTATNKLADGADNENEVSKIRLLFNQAKITTAFRPVTTAAYEKKLESGHTAAAIELEDGTLITAKSSPLLGCSAALLLNATKYLAGIDHEAKLIPESLIEPVQKTKTEYLGAKNPRLHTDEVLVALSVYSTHDDNCRKALEQLPKLRDCQVHSTVMLSEVDRKIFKKLGCGLTCDPVRKK